MWAECDDIFVFCCQGKLCIDSHPPSHLAANCSPANTQTQNQITRKRRKIKPCIRNHKSKDRFVCLVQGVFKMEMLSHLELVIARLGKLVRSVCSLSDLE